MLVLLVPGVGLGGGAASTTAAITGGVGDGALESEIVSSGGTIVITLTGDTWVSSGATFNAQRQNIIDGLDSAQSETNGWNNTIRDVIDVSTVVRTSDTVVTITIPATSGYSITADETITVTVPASALVTSAVAVIATPTITITAEQEVTGSGGEDPERFIVRGFKGTDDDKVVEMVIREFLRTR